MTKFKKCDEEGWKEYELYPKQISRRYYKQYLTGEQFI